MAKTARKTGWVATVMFLACSPVAAQTNLAVYVDNVAGINASALDSARQQAESIYASIGVSILWASSENEDGSGNRPLKVVLVSKSRTSSVVKDSRLPGTVLGVAPPDSRVVYVFCGRIQDVAFAEGHPFAMILGRVLAHELGHQLLPRQGHSGAGIMQAKLDYRSKDVPRFTDAQGAAIRSLLSAS